MILLAPQNHPSKKKLSALQRSSQARQRMQSIREEEEEEEEEEETLFDPKSTNVQITIPHISDIQFKQLCTHIYRHYVHKHSS